MRRVILESPFGSANGRTRQGNIDYGQACLRDCLLRNEAPFASHLLHVQTGVLRDSDPGEREPGIEAGLAWGAVADATVVYTDHGISDGMRRGIERARMEGRPVEYRRLHATWENNE